MEMSLGQAFTKYRELSSQLSNDRKVLTNAADSFGKLEKDKKEIFPQDVDSAIKRLGETKMHREQMKEFYKEAGWKGKVVRFINFFIGNAFAVSKTDAAIKKVEPKLDQLSKKTHGIWVKTSTPSSKAATSSTKASGPLLSQTRTQAPASPYTKYASIFKDGAKFTMLADQFAKTKNERELKNFELQLNQLTDQVNEMRKEAPDYAMLFDAKAIEELFNASPYENVREVTREFEKIFDDPKHFLGQMERETKQIPDKTKLRENIEDKLLYLQQRGIKLSGLRGNQQLDREFAKFLVSDRPPKEILSHIEDYTLNEKELLLKENEKLLEEKSKLLETKQEDISNRLKEIEKGLAQLDKREAELEEAEEEQVLPFSHVESHDEIFKSELAGPATYFQFARESAYKPKEFVEEEVFAPEFEELGEGAQVIEEEVKVEKEMDAETRSHAIINRLSKDISRTTESDSVRTLYDLIHSKARNFKKEPKLKEMENCSACLQFFEKLTKGKGRLVMSMDEEKNEEFVNFLVKGTPEEFPMHIEAGQKDSEGNQRYHLR